MLSLALVFAVVAVASGSRQRQKPEDLTEGVPKTGIEEAKKTHERLQRTVGISFGMQKKQAAAKESVSDDAVISSDRLKSSWALLSVSGVQMTAKEAEDLLSSMYTSLEKTKKVLNYATAQQSVIEKQLSAAKRQGNSKLQSILTEKNTRAKQGIEYILQHVRSKFNLPAKLPSDVQRLEKMLLLKQKAKFAEERSKLSQNQDEERRKRDAMDAEEEKRKADSRNAQDKAKKIAEQEAKAQDKRARQEEAEKAAQRNSRAAVEEKQKAEKRLADARAGKDFEAIERAKRQLQMKQRLALQSQKRLEEAGEKQKQSQGNIDALKKSLSEQKARASRSEESNKRAVAHMQRLEEHGNSKMKSLNRDIQDILKEKQDLLSRKMSLENQMATNMKSAEASVKKNHEEFRKKAERNAKKSATKQVSTMKNIMSEFMAKIAANMPKQAQPAQPAQPAAAGGVQVKGPGGTNVAVPGTTLHIECNGCGGDSNSNSNSDEKESSTPEKSNLEGQVTTAVDAAVAKIVGQHKLRGALNSQDDPAATKKTLDAKTKEAESLKRDLESQKEVTNQLTKKALEKDQKLEELTKA